jgi:hypothetical protein
MVDPFEVTALQIELKAADGSVRRDVYVEQHMEWNLPWRAGGYQGDARIFHSACPSLGGQ